MSKILLTIFLALFSLNAYATQVVVPTSWSNGDTVTAAKLNGINNAFANVINGGLDNTNMASGYKLFQIVANLPSPGNQGNVAFLTSNNTLNLDNGSAWLATVTPTGTLATGDIPYYNSGWQLLAPGAQGLSLVSNGISSLPSYQVIAANGVVTPVPVQGSVVYASTPTVLTSLTPGTSGQFLQTQGPSVNPIWAYAGTPNNIQVITSSQTWNNPGGITKVYVKVIGKGGNGGTNPGSDLGASGGGGSGGYSEGLIGVGSTANIGIGTINSFAGITTISASAGAVGVAGSNTVIGIGGIGGTSSGGSINLNGQSGTNGGCVGAQCSGGNGGNSIMGLGGAGCLGGTASPSCNNGNQFGGGGGGAGGTGTGNPTGGTGDAGAVILYY